MFYNFEDVAETCGLPLNRTSGKSHRLKLQTAKFDFALQAKTANCEIRFMLHEVARSAHGFFKGFAVERPEEATLLGKLHFGIKSVTPRC